MVDEVLGGQELSKLLSGDISAELLVDHLPERDDVGRGDTRFGNISSQIQG